jgi:formylglycine-generating enzyme
MVGNVWEWDETALTTSARGLRGGSFSSKSYGISSSYRNTYGVPLHDQSYFIGFRVATVPEPFTLVSLGASVISLLGFSVSTRPVDDGWRVICFERTV